MRDILETVGWLVLALAIVFLFKGEPDLWDKMHAAAMEHFEQKGAQHND